MATTDSRRAQRDLMTWSIWMSLKKYLLRIFLALTAALLLLNGLFYLQQPHMVFFPTRDVAATPQAWGLAYEDVTLTAEDGVRLHGWYLPCQGARRTLLFFHGNGGNISHRGESLMIFHRLGFNVLIIDYRGYGRSEGVPGEQGFYRDARAAWSYLVDTRGVAPGQITLFGRSLGGAVAAHLAAEVQPAALILESTFASSQDMAAHLFPLLSHVVYLRYDFDTAARLSERKCPLLMLHSREDEIIPYASGRRAFERARSPKIFVELQGDHNSGFIASQPDYEQALKRFVEALPQ